MMCFPQYYSIILFSVLLLLHRISSTVVFGRTSFVLFSSVPSVLSPCCI